VRGIAKREKGRDSNLFNKVVCLSPLPIISDILSQAQAKLHFKNGSAKPGYLSDSESIKLRELLSETVTTLISLIGHTIIEDNLKYPLKSVTLKYFS
jgi:hypothetical protein